MAGEESPSCKASSLRAVKTFFEYDTPKIVHISNKRVGVINRLLQLIILGYIIGYVIIYKKGYQEVDPVVSGTTTKVKGVAQTNYTALSIPNPDNKTEYRIWDVVDYVIPPQGSDTFFVMTNAIYTPKQTQSVCAEDPLYITCHNDSDCKQGVPVTNGNGVQTGNCINSSRDASARVCEIHAWCPVEVDELLLANDTLLQGTEDFTVLIKNNIEFPKFGAKRRNIFENQNETYLKTCTYDKSDKYDRFCPVFRLGSIINETKTNYKDIAILGGVVRININWDCNLDHSIDNPEYCSPVYSFTRLDNPDAKIAKGTNFRFANYYDEGDKPYRDLYKAYGILFMISVTGQAGKFSVIPLLLNIGSGIGLLAIATVVCDIIAMYLLDKCVYYRENKYQNLIEDSKSETQNEDDDVPLLDDRRRNA